MMSSVKKRASGKWRARFRDHAGKEHARHFDRKRDAQDWLSENTAAMRSGLFADPSKSKMTVGEWTEIWLQGYGANRASSLKQARTHIKRINREFGDRRLASIRPSEVRQWTVNLKAEGLADSTVYALHARLAHVFDEAVYDGVVAKSPVSKRTAPKAGTQRAYVATTRQVWALHDAIPTHLRPVVLLGAFAGLRLGEIEGLRVSDVDFLGATITPVQQRGGMPLKTAGSEGAIPVARELVEELSRYVDSGGEQLFVRNEAGRDISRSRIEVGFRRARDAVESLPAGFRIHDLRHYFASLLIAEGLDVKTVQACLRHGSAKTTLDTYGHIWPDKDESARTAVSGVLAARADSLRTVPASGLDSRYSE